MSSFTSRSSTLSLFAYSLLFTSTVLAGSSSGPVAGKSYTISPKSFPDLCVVPSGDSNGANLVVQDCDTSCDIEWVFDGKSLKNTAVDKCMDVTGGNAWSGNLPQVWDCFSWNGNQQYSLAGNKIKWAGHKYCLDLTDGKGVDGTKVQIWQCYDDNPNQVWEFTEMDDGSEGTSPTSSAPSQSVTSPASSSASSIGGNLGAGLGVGVGVGISVGWNHGGGHQGSGGHKPTSSVSASASASASWSSPSASASAGSGNNGNADMSGYLQVSGTKVVDPSGNEVILKGTNLGGWLVWEDWMCGITDNSGSADRFPQTTLTNRFGVDATYELANIWQDNWLVASDFDVLKNMGFNSLRLPFSYKNFIFPNGSYVQNAQGNIDFSRLDWAVQQAKSRGIYIIPVYHIWDGQEEQYSTISENSDDGQSQRDKAGQLWTKIAQHFQGENAIAAFDMINEPTGSWGNLLQQDLYKAIRQGDPKRIIIMESISSAPDGDWTNVMYSMHEYNMMGEDNEGYNQQQFWNGVSSDVNQYLGVGVPAYVGEFMASGDTLDWMLQQMNSMNVWWSGWTYKTVNMDRWGLNNFGSGMSVSVSDDDYGTIKSAWSNMGGVTKSRVFDNYVNACGGSNWKRSTPVVQDTAVERSISDPVAVSPRVEARSSVDGKRSNKRHSGRSRRLARHGKASNHF